MASVDASIRHTFRAHRMELSKYHYDNIAKLEFDIAKYDEQFRKDPTTTFSSEYRRLRYLRTRQRFELESTVDTRQEAVELLQLLRNKWPKIALVLREESRKLFVLPRELRDLIYALLYTSRRGVENLMYARDEIARDLFPRDPYMYLNASVVDPVIATEATQVLYFANTFNIIAQSGTKMRYNYLSHFLHTDHFGSTIKPSQTFLRHLIITFPGRYLCRPTYLDFEQGRPLPKKVKQPYQERQKTPLESGLGEKGQLAGLLDVPHLEHVTLRLTNTKSYGWTHVEYREIAPTIKILKRREVHFQVLALGENWWNRQSESIDVSDLFDDPSEEDRNAFGKTPFAQLAECERKGWIRVWLALHFMVSEERL